MRFPKISLLAALLTFLFCAGTASADLVQVSTSFGPQTALLDNGTHLEWLHLNLTKFISYNSMKQQLQAGGTFADWRYATVDELKQMFIDYDGSPDGVVKNNDALAIQFMKDLGGPTYIADNSANGFHREDLMAKLDVAFDLGHAYYGYIAIDNFNGATITPNLQGSSIDSFADFTAGYWLVQSSPTSVPEPASIFLMANGLIAVSAKLVRRRHR